MEQEFKWYDIITATVFILNIFVATIFFVKNFKISTTHKIISIILALLLLRTFSIHLLLTQEILNLPHFLLVSHLVSRIGLPLLYLMVVFEIQKRHWKPYDLLHAIPWILYLSNFSNIFTLPAAEKVTLIHKVLDQGYDFIWDQGLFLNETQVYLIRVVPFVFYILSMAYLLVKNFQRLSPALKDFFTAIIIFMALNLIPVLLSKLFNIAVLSDVYVLNVIGFGSTLCMLLYFFFIPNFIFHNFFLEAKTETDENDNLESVSDKQKEALLLHFEQIEKYILDSKCFTNPDLTVVKLSELTGIPPRKISQTLKVIRNQNFNQYINEIRINFLIEQPRQFNVEKQSIADIAFSLGFNSVNSFYTYFKDFVGCTPRVYFDTLATS
jgi:AraC-like DNA-binding protein